VQKYIAEHKIKNKSAHLYRIIIRSHQAIINKLKLLVSEFVKTMWTSQCKKKMFIYPIVVFVGVRKGGRSPLWKIKIYLK